MSPEEALDPSRHPSKFHTDAAGGEPDGEAAAPGVLVIAPPGRLVYVNQSARRLLAEVRRPWEGGHDATVLSQREAISRFVQQLSARMFRSVPLVSGASTPLEIKDLNRSFGAHLRMHGLLFQDRGDLQQRRALVVFDRASPR